MSIRQIDPLLAIANAIVLLFQAALVLATAALLIALPAVQFFWDDIIAGVRTEMADPAFVLPLVPVTALLIMALGIVVLLFLFLQNLRRIIRTVGQGDPFVPANADRLTGMAWIMLGAEMLSLFMMGVGYRLVSMLPATDADPVQADHGFGLDFSGPILILTLFILARVFRQGAAMRADLEGIV
ncbi:DUF2975 domain-containing protein [Croceibacterium sp. TMG7-5b_MA50]|uniref:DUF2975 domain-containing protein n=1 Tax=Croceibacterium sp. TMG7-5b_MA50 TaxID=3121290 RepID=UPI00322142C9